MLGTAHLTPGTLTLGVYVAQLLYLLLLPFIAAAVCTISRTLVFYLPIHIHELCLRDMHDGWD